MAGTWESGTVIAMMEVVLSVDDYILGQAFRSQLGLHTPAAFRRVYYILGVTFIYSVYSN